jgi:hypothetical protein
VKRIAIALFVLNFVASPALADGIKGVVGTVGMGALSTMACVLTVVYLPDEEEESAEDFDRRGFFIGAGAGFAGEDFSFRIRRGLLSLMPAPRRLHRRTTVGA